MQDSRKNEALSSTSSFIRRKSLKGISDTFEDLPQNDDEAERKQRKRDSGVYANLASKRVSLGGITDLSTSELVAQYANCMRLCAENKINHKNAFNLPLIDCMKLLLKNKDEKMENFQVVGCTLDASAKIYGSRVDRVHMDGISFAKGLGSRSRDLPASQREGSDNELEGEENVPQKKKRGKKPPKLSRDVNKINLPENVDLQDPTFVVLSKQFSNCQPSFISFFPKLKLVGDNCKIILDMNAPFLADPIESGYGNETVPFECDADENAEIISLPYKNILSRDLDDTEYNSLLNASVLEDSFDVRDDVENNFNDMPDDRINDETIGNGLIEGYSCAKNSSSWKEGCEMKLEATRAGCVARNGAREKVVDVQEAILKHVKEGSNLDYLYTNLDRMLWAGPTHWHSLPRARVRDKNCAMASNLKRKEKKLSKMEFLNPETIKLTSQRCASLTTQYIENNWSADQVTNPPDLHIEFKILTRYFLRANCGFIYSSGKTPMPPEDEDVHDYDYNNLNDSQHFCPAASPGPTSDGDNSGSKDLPGFEGESEPAPDIHSLETASADAWCMVDPPTKVARIQVPYAQHAKKIDMKVLKSAIWKVLCEDSSSDSNDADLTPRKKKKNDKVNCKVDSASLTSMTKEMKFSELEQKVLKIVPPDMAQELSMPLVFTALLHLANERVLSLRGLDDHSDIFISQDCGADSFVRRLQERQFK